ncbi:3-oxoacyl-[acyl-carrier-protein] synthase III C-terminal domain-containing protein [Streptomyces alboniger]|uniref:PhlD n=1 Tax=Streptomyces alboniger TaxID=132473 RepID=A0A5J6HD68_STRAD|nr:3-oxoacyl-[acyl-carrier-protein] synthase III C-terminal domain-containing protein [Streptomyces alboniger]QEV16373.1 PhlD [Streptomyces alboniger]
MPAFVSVPRTVLGAHKVTTDEIADDIRAHHRDHPRLNAILRVVNNCGVRTRHFTRPLASPTVSGTADVQDRTEAAFQDAVDMSEQAAQEALRAAGLAPHDIDAIVTTHATGWAVPNLDVHLVDRLGLRPTVRRTALTTVACAGGVQAMIRAADLVTARPASKVLVVAAEVLSTSYNHTADTIESMIYKTLFADAAAATVVTGAPSGPGLVIDDTFEYALPGSLDRYRGRLDPHGMHFDSTKQAPDTVASTLPPLLDWLGDHSVDFAVIHPGSLRIITGTADALGLAPADTQHSVDTLSDEGNMGGVSVFRVLERTHATPPADGANGVALAFGPGFITAALRCRWQS